jgi:hypothetical protein
MYESLIAFKLIFVLPKSNDERIILYNMFVAQGLTERLRAADEDLKESHSERIAQENEDIAACKKDIQDTNLYKKLDKQSQNIIDSQFGKKYRYRFTDDNKPESVNFESAYTLLNVREDLFHGMYAYKSLQAHPSYLFLCQFRDAYRDNCEASVGMAKFAAQCVLTYMSIFIIDYMKLNAEVNDWFNPQDLTRRFVVGMYEDIMRVEGKYKI